MKSLSRCTLLLLVGALAAVAQGEVKVPGVISDHMVVQRDMPIVLWGWADAGEEVSAKLEGESKSTTANDKGEWRLELSPRKAGGPYTIAIEGTNRIDIQDVLIGDVWLCSGQSNMEWPTKQANNAEQEMAAANHPQIRLYHFPRVRAAEPKVECPATWELCTTETIPDFTAVGYFFGRELQPEIGVPLGLVESAYGGTPSESWTSREALLNVEEAKPLMEQMDKDADYWTSGKAMADYQKALTDWRNAGEGLTEIAPGKHVFIKNGKTNGVKLNNFEPTADGKSFVSTGSTASLLTEEGIAAGDFRLRMELTLHGVKDGNTNVILGDSQFGFLDGSRGQMHVKGPLFGDGLQFCRSRTRLSEEDQPVVFEAIRDGDTLRLEVNGEKVRETECGPAPLGPVGIHVGPGQVEVNSIVLEGAISPDAAKTVAYSRPTEPTDPRVRHFHPCNLYNGMIHPMLPMRLKGAIWYQGESNGNRAHQYQALFPAMIKCWRKEFNLPELPFFFVQLANFREPAKQPGDAEWGELREAQTMTLSLPKTGMAVAIDVGEAYDIHPRDKQTVGKRLALAARAIVYGEDIPYSGPIYKDMKVEGDKVRLSFDHVDGGLVAKGGELKHFAIAGADHQFHWAKAQIDGDTVVVSHPDVKEPASVRYAWSDNPEGCNLYNKAGLPASPFRTDDWKGLTDDKYTR